MLYEKPNPPIYKGVNKGCYFVSDPSLDPHSVPIVFSQGHKRLKYKTLPSENKVVTYFVTVRIRQLSNLK